MKKILQSTFIKRYCNASNLTEKEANEAGLFAIKCECDEPGCKGWNMISKENLKSHIDLYLHNNK